MDDNIPIYQYGRLTSTYLKPPKSSKPITTSSFEISPEYIDFLQKQPVLGEDEENPYTHLQEFGRICDLLRIEGMSDETIQWKLFPFSLMGKAKHWYKLNVGSFQGDSRVLHNNFHLKYFPITKEVDLRNEILTFGQLEEQSLDKSWDCFIDLTLTSPNHRIPEHVLLEHFFAGLSREDKKSLNTASGGSFFHLSTSDARNWIDKMSGKTPCPSIQKPIPEKEKESVLEQEEVVPIAKSQPFQSQDLAIDPKPSIPQNSLREGVIPTLDPSNVGGLDFWFHKRLSSRDNLNSCKKGCLKECPDSYYEEVEDGITSDAIEAELSHIENSIFSPSMFLNHEPISKPIIDLVDSSYPLHSPSYDDPSNQPNHRSHEDHEDDQEMLRLWQECVEWMGKEETLMLSNLGSISNGESLTPFEDNIHPSMEENQDETNLGEISNIQIGDEDDINEHGIYSITTSSYPCSYETSP